MKTFTSIARPVKSGMRPRTWRRSSRVAAGSAGPVGWWLPMSLVFRRPALPATSERVVVRLSEATAAPTAAPTHVTHTHQHTHASFHRHVRPMLRQEVHVHPPAAASTLVKAETRQAVVMSPIPPLRLRAPAQSERSGHSEPSQGATRSEVTSSEPPADRVWRRTGVAAEPAVSPEIAVPASRFVIRPRRFAELAQRLEQAEARGEFGRPALLVHRARRWMPKTEETQTEELPAAALPGRTAAPIVWRRVQPAPTPEADVQAVVGAQTAAANSSIARTDARMTSSNPPVSGVAPPPSRPVTIEGPALDRLAEDVMQRIDRRLRIERERRGM